MSIGEKVLVYLNGSKVVGVISDKENDKYVVKLSDGSNIVTSKEYLEIYKG